jgi:peroxiredoxin
LTDTATHPITEGAATVPLFELPDERGGAFSLPDRLPEGPVVLLFYRGDW